MSVNSVMASSMHCESLLRQGSRRSPSTPIKTPINSDERPTKADIATSARFHHGQGAAETLPRIRNLEKFRPHKFEHTKKTSNGLESQSLKDAKETSKSSERADSEREMGGRSGVRSQHGVKPLGRTLWAKDVWAMKAW